MGTANYKSATNRWKLGIFHSLSKPTKAQPITTEHALKRLYILGLTKEDEPIKKAIDYMSNCLSLKNIIPDRREKVINWDAFELLMLATWIRIFDPNHKQANEVAKMWGKIITESFKDCSYNEEIYQKI